MLYLIFLKYENIPDNVRGRLWIVVPASGKLQAMFLAAGEIHNILLDMDTQPDKMIYQIFEDTDYPFLPDIKIDMKKAWNWTHEEG